MFNTESIYGSCGVCNYMVVVRKDGKLRQHFVSRTKGAENTQLRRAKKRFGVDPIPPRSDSDRRGDVEIIETTEEVLEDSTSDETRRELGIGRKRWRINVVIEWSRST